MSPEILAKARETLELVRAELAKEPDALDLQEAWSALDRAVFWLEEALEG